MKHFWEFLTLVGFLLMSGELFVRDKGKLNRHWSAVMSALIDRGITKNLGGQWRQWARNDILSPILFASFVIWMPLIFLSYVDFANEPPLAGVLASSLVQCWSDPSWNTFGAAGLGILFSWPSNSRCIQPFWDSRCCYIIFPKEPSQVGVPTISVFNSVHTSRLSRRLRKSYFPISA
jgi:hypothetical protein